MDCFEFGYVFIYFFFVVVGGFFNYQVREIEVGIFIGFVEVVVVFDKWVEVVWEIFFCFFDGFIGG